MARLSCFSAASNVNNCGDAGNCARRPCLNGATCISRSSSSGATASTPSTGEFRQRPDWGKSPAEWGDSLFVCPFICHHCVRPKGPPARADCRVSASQALCPASQAHGQTTYSTPSSGFSLESPGQMPCLATAYGLAVCLRKISLSHQNYPILQPTTIASVRLNSRAEIARRESTFVSRKNHAETEASVKQRKVRLCPLGGNPPGDAVGIWSTPGQ